MIKNVVYGLLLALALSACGTRTEIGEQPASTVFCLHDSLRGSLVVDTLRERPIVQHLTLTGDVSYNPDKVVRFISLVEGVVVSSSFSLGEYVRKGQLLAAIKSPELNTLQAEKVNLETQILIAERTYSAADGMYKDNITSERDLLVARGGLQKLRAELKNVEASLSLFNPNPTQGTFDILAPTDGYVVEKNINPGMQINDGEELFTISGLNEVWVMVNVYATDMQFVKEGMDVEIRTLAYPDEVFNGKISALSKVFDTEERVLKGRIMLQNDSLKLKPGMSADILVEKLSADRAVALPASAVIFDNNENFVVVYKSDCEFEVRKISYLSKDNQWYFVRQGVADGEKIVTQNHLLIFEQIKSL